MARVNKTGINWAGPTKGNALRQTYNSWANMKRRCDSVDPRYAKYYKDKGITVCPEWENSFENFLNDMGPCPDDSYSLDRIDSSQNYCKENCRWASPLLQALNRSYSDSQGVYNNHGRWTARMKFAGKYVTLGTHEDIEVARKLRQAAERVIERLIEIEVLK